MSKLRILLAAVLCVSLLTFVGCGEDGSTDGNAENGTVTEENTDMNNSNGNGNNSNDGSMMDDLENDAEDAVDGLENDARDAADNMRNGNSSQSRENNSKESNVGQ